MHVRIICDYVIVIEVSVDIYSTEVVKLITLFSLKKPVPERTQILYFTDQTLRLVLTSSHDLCVYSRLVTI